MGRKDRLAEFESKLADLMDEYGAHIEASYDWQVQQDCPGGLRITIYLDRQVNALGEWVGVESDTFEDVLSTDNLR
jgi:hypothetical protein